MMNAMEFLDALRAHYRLSSDVAQSEVARRSWFQSMQRQMVKFEKVELRKGVPLPGDVLQVACDQIIASHKKEWFPLPSACIEACREAARFLKSEAEKIEAEKAKASGKQVVSKDVVMTDDEILEWATLEIIKSGRFGQQAERENWHMALRDFIVKNGRLPIGPEIANCKRDSQETMRFIEHVFREHGVVGDALNNLKGFSRDHAAGIAVKSAEGMLERRRKLSERIKALGARA